MRKRPWKRIIGSVAAVVAVIAAVMLAVWLYTGTTGIVLHEERVNLKYLDPADDGLRVAVLSDTHFDAGDAPRAAMIAERINRLKPDLIVLLGDFINGTPDPRDSLSMPELTRFASSLRAGCGKFAVTGNHELWYDRGAVIRALAAGGAADLTNRSTVIRTPSGRQLALAGLPDYTTQEQRSCPQSPPGIPTLILMHDPNSARFVPPERGFLLAGHTHGGQFRLCPNGGERTSLRLAMVRLKNKLGMIPPWQRPYALFDRWFMEFRGRLLFITSGAGGNRLKLRIFCPPEIVLLKLYSADPAAAAQHFNHVQEL